MLFIGLKLANVIDWPWWQVFMPIIINLVILVIALVIMGIAYFADR